MPGAVAPVRLLLTRPRAQADEWARRMAALGVPTVSLPLIDIEPAGDPAPIAAAWSALPAFAMRCPSNMTATALPPPGMPTRIEVIDPPNPTPV